MTNSRRKSPSALFLILIGFIIVQCSTNKTGDILITEENGVTTVANPEVPLYPDAEFLCEEELSIGLEDGDSNYVFFRINGIEADSEGNIYVLEGGNLQIKVFNEAGEFLYSIGKKGRGPGEFLGPLQFGMDKNENIHILDMQNKRATKVTKKGEQISDFTISEGFPSGFFIDDNGRLYYSKSIRGETPAERFLNIGKYDSDGKILTDFGNFPNTQIKFITTGSGNFAVPSGSDSRPIWGIDPNGNMYLGISDKYEIKVYTGENELYRKITRKWTPLKLTPEEKAEKQKSFARMPAEVRDQIEVPNIKPALYSFNFDEAHNFWIRIPGEYGIEGRIYDIFSPEGKYIYQIKIPFIPGLFKNGKIYSIEQTEDGIEMVKRYNYNLKER